MGKTDKTEASIPQIANTKHSEPSKKANPEFWDALTWSYNEEEKCVDVTWTTKNITTEVAQKKFHDAKDSYCRMYDETSIKLSITKTADKKITISYQDNSEKKPIQDTMTKYYSRFYNFLKFPFNKDINPEIDEEGKKRQEERRKTIVYNQPTPQKLADYWEKLIWERLSESTVEIRWSEKDADSDKLKLSIAGSKSKAQKRTGTKIPMEQKKKGENSYHILRKKDSTQEIVEIIKPVFEKVYPRKNFPYTEASMNLPNNQCMIQKQENTNNSSEAVVSSNLDDEPSTQIPLLDLSANDSFSNYDPTNSAIDLDQSNFSNAGSQLENFSFTSMPLDTDEIFRSEFFDNTSKNNPFTQGKLSDNENKRKLDSSAYQQKMPMLTFSQNRKTASKTEQQQAKKSKTYLS